MVDTLVQKIFAVFQLHLRPKLNLAIIVTFINKVFNLSDFMWLDDLTDSLNWSSFILLFLGWTLTGGFFFV